MVYDVVIIGLGPAGYTAGIYCARYGLKTLVLGKEKGGAITEAPEVWNVPGFYGESGVKIMQKFYEHAEKLGIEIKEENVTGLKKKKNHFLVETDDNEFEAKTLILAMGTERKSLNVAGEDKFIGKGISYCFTCDAAFFKGKDVAVVGAGDSGAMACELLSRYANKIYWIIRSEVRAEPMHIAHVKKLGKTEVVKGEIAEILGNKFVEAVKLKDCNNLKVQGVFIEIGATPSTLLCKETGVKLNKAGYIIADKEQKTNVYGVFAAGDICDNLLKQVITSCAEGAIAALGVYNFLKGG